MLRRALSRRSSNEIEWTPVYRRASYEPQPILPPTPGGVPQPQYNTFGDDGDAAWQAAKQDWYAAIAAAKKAGNRGHPWSSPQDYWTTEVCAPPFPI